LSHPLDKHHPSQKGGLEKLTPYPSETPAVHGFNNESAHPGTSYPAACNFSYITIMKERTHSKNFILTEAVDYRLSDAADLLSDVVDFRDNSVRAATITAEVDLRRGVV